MTHAHAHNVNSFLYIYIYIYNIVGYTNDTTEHRNRQTCEHNTEDNLEVNRRGHEHDL